MPHRRRAVSPALLALLGTASGLVLVGCETLQGRPEQAPKKSQRTQAASREELLYLVQRNVQRLSTVRAQANVVAIDQNQVVPASIGDVTKKQLGKAYEVAFNQRRLQGYVVMDRSRPDLPPRVTFHAEVMGVERVLELMAIGDNFWVKIPNPDKGLGQVRSVLYFGRLDRSTPRPEGNFSMRPQDMLDLFVCRETLVSYRMEKAKEFVVETWPDYYIINVLRVNPDEAPPVKLFSRIWVERHGLTVAIHQIYDVAGQMMAEARFTHYVKIGQGADAVFVPLQTRFIWPRDKVVLDVHLRRDTLKVNYRVDERVWDRRPKSRDAKLVEITATSRGYRFAPITRDEYEGKGEGTESTSSGAQRTVAPTPRVIRGPGP